MLYYYDRRSIRRKILHNFYYGVCTACACAYRYHFNLTAVAVRLDYIAPLAFLRRCRFFEKNSRIAAVRRLHDFIKVRFIGRFTLERIMSAVIDDSYQLFFKSNKTRRTAACVFDCTKKPESLRVGQYSVIIGYEHRRNIVQCRRQTIIYIRHQIVYNGKIIVCFFGRKRKLFIVNYFRFTVMQTAVDDRFCDLTYSCTGSCYKYA